MAMMVGKITGADWPPREMDSQAERSQANGELASNIRQEKWKRSKGFGRPPKEIQASASSGRLPETQS